MGETHHWSACATAPVCLAACACRGPDGFFLSLLWVRHGFLVHSVPNDVSNFPAAHSSRAKIFMFVFFSFHLGFRRIGQLVGPKNHHMLHTKNIHFKAGTKRRRKSEEQNAKPLFPLHPEPKLCVQNSEGSIMAFFPHDLIFSGSGSGEIPSGIFIRYTSFRLQLIYLYIRCCHHPSPFCARGHPSVSLPLCLPLCVCVGGGGVCVPKEN